MDTQSRQNSLLERIALGEHEAVAECLDNYGGLVWGLARRLTPSLSDAEDAVQEIFTEVWLSAGRFDPQKSSETTFIGLLARRRLIDRLRRDNRKPEAANISLDEFDVPSALPGPDSLELEDEAAKAQQCLQRLSDKQRTVIGLSIHHGLSHSNISAFRYSRRFQKLRCNEPLTLQCSWWISLRLIASASQAVFEDGV